MDGIAGLQEKKLLRVDEVAKILNISRWTVYRWVEAGRLGGTRIGAGSLRIFSDTVTALIEHHYVGIAEKPTAFPAKNSDPIVPIAPARQRNIRGMTRVRSQALV